MLLKQLLPVWASRRTDWDGSSARTEREPHSCPLKTPRRGKLTPGNRSADKQREESRHKCVHEQNSANANGDISTALARPPAPAGSLSMHFRWPVACYRAAAFFKGGETRCRRNGGIWLYRPVTSPHNRPCRRQQNKAFKSINNTDKYVHLPSSHRLRDLYNCVGWILARISEKAFAKSQQGSV